MRRWLLQELMNAMVREDEAKAEELKKELKEYLNNIGGSDGKEFAYSLIDVMEIWADELRKSKRFKEALLDFIEESFIEVYETIDRRCGS